MSVSRDYQHDVKASFSLKNVKVSRPLKGANVVYGVSVGNQNQTGIPFEKTLALILENDIAMTTFFSRGSYTAA